MVPEGKHENGVFRGERVTSLCKGSGEDGFASLTQGKLKLRLRRARKGESDDGLEVVKDKEVKAVKCLWMPLLISSRCLISKVRDHRNLQQK